MHPVSKLGWTITLKEYMFSSRAEIYSSAILVSVTGNKSCECTLAQSHD